MKTMITLFTLIGFLMINGERNDTLFQYELDLINGETITLEEYRGEVLLIVNTASECGFTRQYSGLQELFEAYSDKGFKVLGFPANNFGGQEPGSDEEIAVFCEVNFGVNFPLFSKVSVRGEDQHPFFETLTNWENPDFSGDISWNFEKFLIDRNGNLVRRFNTRTEPDSEEMISAIEAVL
ncbi:MAG: glutathione peroxidase [Balneolaceae bacterium]|nr:MAG: glutathione peroxidase [Balneolaceae bacterium]